MHSMFPEWDETHPPPSKREAKAWKLTPLHEHVLSTLRGGAKSERELHDWLVERIDVGRRVTTSVKVQRAVDELARRGYVEDRGDRGRWTARGREILWHAVPIETGRTA